MKSLLREPLVHFAVAALLVFAVHGVWTTYVARQDGTITISRADLQRMAALYASESGALPSQADMAAMVSDRIRDEALSREARRLGLDRDDTIVERRLAQKMTFMISDLAETPEPDEATLRAWYDAHVDTYTRPPEVTFEHVFLSPERHGDTLDRDAATLLATLNAPAAPDWQTLGDPFILQRAYGDLPIREVVRLFGADFAGTLAGLAEMDEWQGPVQSAFGLHLVHVIASTPSHVEPFETVRAKVEADWREDALRAANEAAVDDIVQRYKVHIEGAE
ncbi:peptidyl-prolyl cis-trans isomerase [Hyphomonas johnsonii]|uniref:peptidylprolyl isomerase n=1 Tax=Hyphomonas johnsonii MHS-2 TaxID=1280950 RepID=A0A059F9Q6_9PROT|nr:peptidylprolyl isomerase [Hyphomonas johnsonii]KCZ87332.1 hypothetical protein HJO_16837 [Hyphomonas johnsonii MHS-2]